MLEFEEFKKYKSIEDNENPFVKLYKLEDGTCFYVEPNFHTQLINLKEHFYYKFDDIIETIISIAKRNKKVIFTGDYDAPIVYKDDYIYREISDILNEMKLAFDNKGNPDSDYKD